MSRRGVSESTIIQKSTDTGSDRRISLCVYITMHVCYIHSQREDERRLKVGDYDVPTFDDRNAKGRPTHRPTRCNIREQQMYD
jgi:hypothetical protein